MEVRINREIREYTESVFFGLSLRQFFFSALACVVAVGTYFLLRPVLGLEAVSWICILAAFPFAMIGFVKYNGMSAEKFIAAWVKSEILMPKHLTFGNTNMYCRIMTEARKQQEKYITITVTRKDIEEARTYFRRAGAELMAHFSQMGSDCIELDPKERLRIIYDFYRAGEETSFHFDFKDRMRKGHDFRDYICPDCFENERDHFRIGDRYGRVLFLHQGLHGSRSDGAR